MIIEEYSMLFGNWTYRIGKDGSIMSKLGRPNSTSHWIPINTDLTGILSLAAQRKSSFSTMSFSQNCCGGYSGAMYDASANNWKCKDCGVILSTDPNYIAKASAKTSAAPNQQTLSPFTYSPPNNVKPSILNDPLLLGELSDKLSKHEPKCECGSESVGSDRHSGYCPKYPRH